MSSPSQGAATPTLRVDAHQHFWRYRPAQYQWIGPRHAALKRDFTPGDLQPELAAQGFDASIAVQARQQAEETDDLLDLAQRNRWIAGVVGWADLRSEGLQALLERWAQAPQFVGLRHQLQDEPSPALLMGDAAFERGMKALQTRGLAYDVLIKERDLPAATAFCQRHDRHHLILDHLGKPDVSRNDPWAWADRVAPLAALPHVSCKLSGLITEADWQRWKPEALLPYFHLAVELFGPARLMFGSDWPVCQLAGTYRDVHQLFAAAVSALSPSEQGAMAGGNALRIYGLEDYRP